MELSRAVTPLSNASSVPLSDACGSGSEEGEELADVEGEEKVRHPAPGCTTAAVGRADRPRPKRAAAANRRRAAMAPLEGTQGAGPPKIPPGHPTSEPAQMVMGRLCKSTATAFWSA